MNERGECRGLKCGCTKYEKARLTHDRLWECACGHLEQTHLSIKEKVSAG
jgi:hypothetical protein